MNIFDKVAGSFASSGWQPPPFESIDPASRFSKLFHDAGQDAKKMRAAVKELTAYRATLTKDEDDAFFSVFTLSYEQEKTRRINYATADIASTTCISLLYFSIIPQYKLRGLPTSYLPALRKAFGEGDIFAALWKREETKITTALASDFADKNRNVNRELPNILAAAQSYLIRHDWRAAIKPQDSYSEEALQLPTDNCLFEFQIEGIDKSESDSSVKLTVAVWVAMDPQTSQLIFVMFASVDNGISWTAMDGGPGLVASGPRSLPPQARRVVQYALDQVACALSVINSERTIVEARNPTSPERDAIRRTTKPGKVPFYTFKVVDIKDSERIRRDHRLKPDSKTGRHLRCHFRHGSSFILKKTGKQSGRPGHWAGDINLGFIDKAYRVDIAEVKEAMVNTMNRNALSDDAKAKLSSLLDILQPKPKKD